MRRPTVVLTSGVFSLLHRGHLNLLWASKRFGDILVVGVVSDDGAAAYKGRLPTDTLEQRMAAVGRLGFVDVVVPQGTTDPTPLLERFRPDIFTHGSDWKQLREGQETLARLGIEWRLLPYTEGISTTALRQALGPSNGGIADV